MLDRRVHLAGVAVAVAGTELGVAFGGGPTGAVAYGLAVLLGVVLVAQGERRSVAGSVPASTLAGFATGTAVCVLAGAALLAGLLGLPWDLALWRAGIRTWGAWAGVGAALVSAYFLAGLASSLR